ncbi:hypothetical protein FSP39_009342 [Pinctada imbricata]|uniref:RING-type E3 ubiquitin transferase n=1 Tax=Pinctada imbricata TaxID=66713 RepID=A0AA88YC71_PINIB|nr:hypothetical protein FSP39_009342 [Pinctada imbricata]
MVQLLSQSRDSPGEFRSPKRRRIATPEKASTSGAGTAGACNDEEDEGNCCPICFDDWTTSGSHRLSSLKCGHLFGQSCIEKWLKGQGGKCPQCNAKAKRQDIRVLYAKSIKAIDTTERDRALQDLEKEKEARRKAEMEAAQSRLQFQMVTEENNRLKTELDRVRQQLHASGKGSVSSALGSVSPTKAGSVSQLSGQFNIDRTIKIWEAGNCRVMAYSPSLATLVVSQPSTSPLFPGFGIRKISAMDFKTSQYLTIHSKAIRDVSFHPLLDDGILLSCGLDKTVKMTSVISNAVVQSYDTQHGVWSCIWNWDDHNYFYAGQQNGRVLEFDIRNTSEHVQELNTEGSRSPIVSLQYIPKDQQASFRPGGLLVGQLDRISFFERKSEDNFRLHMLPLEGNLTSLCFEPITRHILASFRPTARHPTTRHQVCEMVSSNISTDPTRVDNACTCHIIHTFHGGRTQSVLSRSTILPHPQDNSRMIVCAGEETTSMVHLWDSGTGQLKQRLHTGGVVVDICPISANQQLYLAALTEKHLRIMKWS